MMIKSRIIPRLIFRKQTLRYASKKSPGTLQIPFSDDLSTSNADMLEYFPNLEGFYSIDKPVNTLNPDTTEYDFSDIPVLGKEKEPVSVIDFDKQYSLEDIQRLSKEDIKDHYDDAIYDDGFEELKNMTNFNTRAAVTTNSTHIDYTLFAKFKNYLQANDTNAQNHFVDLESISKRNEPMTIISKFHNPYINLALEYYIYDNMPVSTDSSRLITYKNKPCIVIGKNQNPFKEINMHYSNITSTPILRRLSGGGTVVHDLGNVNFSFMSKKSDFDRTNFTDTIIGDLNKLVGNEVLTLYGKLIKNPQAMLGTISKGDIVNILNNKKISGSAFKLSKGKFLHHGTMLLDSHLSNLRKLLKLSPSRKESIIAHGTDSIPSSVENYEIDESLFLYSIVKSYNREYSSADESVHIIDNYESLPKEVVARANELSHWSWVFGKTPYFKHVLNHDKFKVVFEVEKFCVKSVKIETADEYYEEAFDELVKIVNEGHKFRYIGNEVACLIQNPEVSKWLNWEIDFNSNYENFGVDLEN